MTTEMGGRQAQMLSALASAADAFQKSGDRALEASTRLKLGLRLLALEAKESFEQFSRAAELYSELNDVSGEAQARAIAASVLGSQGRYEESLPYFAKAVRLFKDCGDDITRARAEDGWLAALVELQRWNEVLDHCARIVEFTKRRHAPEFREFELNAHYHWARCLGLRGQYEAALPHARRAADLAAGRGEYEAEVQMRMVVATILQKLKRYGAALEEYERVLTPASKSDNRELIAQSWFQHARSLEHTTRPIPRLTCAQEYRLAAKLFDACGADREAGDAYYNAARSLSYQSRIEPQYREENFVLYCLAAERFEATANWWGKGIAEFGAANVLLKDSPSDPEDPRKLPLLRRSVYSFSRAEPKRPADEATSRLVLSVHLGILGKTDECIQSALVALRSYERARPSLLLPQDRERTQKQIAWAFQVLTGEALGAAATKQSDPKWQELIWRLEQAAKGRSFQDQRLQNEAWNLLLTQDKPLREATRRVQSLTQELDDLTKRINDCQLHGRSYCQLHGRIETLQEVANEWDAKRLALDEAEREQRLRLDKASQHVPDAMELASVSAASVAEVQSGLNPAEAYLGFLWEFGSIARILLRPNGDCSITVADLTEIDGFDQWLREAKQRGTFVSTEPEATAGAANVHMAQVLLGEIPDGVETLIISPHRPLIGIPWHQLALPSSADNDKTLGDHYAIGILPAVGLLRQLRSEERVKPEAAYFGVACNSDGRIPLVDAEVTNIAQSYFDSDNEPNHLITENCHQLFELQRNVQLLHFACHAARDGLRLSLDNRWTTPVELLDLNLRADILLLTGCSAGDFAEHDNNEFLGIVRQMLVVTQAKAAIVSVHPTLDSAGIVFSDLVISALTNRNPGRPWQIPSKPLPAGHAVEWARRRLREMSSEDVEPIVSDYEAELDEAELDPAHPSWWSPWFVVGDPHVVIDWKKSYNN